MTAEPVPEPLYPSPRYHHAETPAGATSHIDEIHAMCELAGVALDEWQAQWLHQVTLEQWDDKAQDYRWVHPSGCLLVPRQCGKTLANAVLAAYLVTFGLPPGSTVMFSAHRLQASKEALRYVEGILESHPQLAKHLAKIRHSSGHEAIEMTNGSRILFSSRTASTSSAGRGLALDAIIVDEAIVLSEQALASMLPALSARPNPLLLFTSSAGDSSSEALRRIRDQGRAGIRGLLYTEYGVSDDAPIDDPAAWEAANPAMASGRLSEAAIRAELASLRPTDFRRERLGGFSDQGAVAALDVQLLRDNATNEIEMPGEGCMPVVAVDVAVDATKARSAAICCAWIDPEDPGQIKAVITDADAGVDWLPTALSQVMAAAGVSDYMMSIGGASDVVTALDAHSIRCEPVKAQQWRGLLAGGIEMLKGGNVTVQRSAALETAAKVTPARWWPDGSSTLNFSATQGHPQVAALGALLVALHGVQRYLGQEVAAIF